MAERTRTTDRGKRVTEPVTADTVSTAPTGRPVEPTSTSPRRDDARVPSPSSSPSTSPRPVPAPRTGVLVNVETVQTAFATGDASQTVGYVQHVLRTQGLEPGNLAGIADHQTRVAIARLQERLGEPPTGLPTEVTLDHLGFDVT